MVFGKYTITLMLGIKGILKGVLKMEKESLLVILLLILAMFLPGCNGIVDTPGIYVPTLEDLSFENNTKNNLSIQITSTFIETNIDSFTIEPGATKIIRSEGGKIPAFVVSVVGQPSLNVDYSEYKYSKKVVFWSTYQYKVKYKITGTAPSVFVTLSNATGGTEQYSDVSLPKVYGYNYFNSKFLYISAQNSGSSGTVKVECYYKGKLKDSANSEGAYVIASASHYISD